MHIGLYDGWKWTDNSLVNYTNWANGEPYYEVCIINYYVHSDL